MGTGGQFIDSSKSPYSLSTFGVTVSYRYNINLGKKNTFGIAISFHKVFSNYIDDVGGDSYPNADKLYSKSGAAAVYFANPTSDYIIPGRLRSSPDNPSDSYILFNLLYTRKLFK